MANQLIEVFAPSKKTQRTISMVVRFSEDIPKKRKKDNVQWHEFLSLDSPHPYGVLPAGNRLLLDTTKEDSSAPSSGSCKNDQFFGKIRDETWLSILGFCDGVSLGSLVQVCRFFYVAGHQPELWRDLVLRKLHSSDDDDDGPSKAVIDAVGGSWKDTYVLKHCRQNKLDCPARPMKIPGIYSDDLYRLHSCRAFAIPPSWLQEEPIISTVENTTASTPDGFVTRVRAEDLTCDDFVTNFEKPNQPVVIQGAAKTWKAFKDWQDPAYLRKHTEGRTFRATSGAGK